MCEKCVINMDNISMIKLTSPPGNPVLPFNPCRPGAPAARESCSSFQSLSTRCSCWTSHSLQCACADHMPLL